MRSSTRSSPSFRPRSSSTSWSVRPWPSGGRGAESEEKGPGLLVGVSRAITDANYCTYLSDLAVDASFQGRGIGRELIERTHEAAGLETMLVLLAAPGARTYYPHVGLVPHESCWIIPRVR
jgi:predicted N-acetyltransferase YhbS